MVIVFLCQAEREREREREKERKRERYGLCKRTKMGGGKVPLGVAESRT